VGALAHYLEDDGIPTTQISLIHKHTEIIKPPRALWVPFELGRPLGTPDHPEFQSRVALAALKLLGADQGPVLESFPEEAPDTGRSESEEPGDWACPVRFSPPVEDKNEQEQMAEALHRELTELRPWYDLGIENRGRTSLVAFVPETAADLIADYLVNETPDSSPEELSPSVALRLAAQDIKSFYFEAVISKPGAGVPDSNSFDNWFWNETAAGKALQKVRKICSRSEDKELKNTAQMFLVPVSR